MSEPACDEAVPQIVSDSTYRDNAVREALREKTKEEGELC